MGVLGPYDNLAVAPIAPHATLHFRVDRAVTGAITLTHDSRAPYVISPGPPIYYRLSTKSNGRVTTESRNTRRVIWLPTEEVKSGLVFAQCLLARP